MNAKNFDAIVLNQKDNVGTSIKFLKAKSNIILKIEKKLTVKSKNNFNFITQLIISTEEFFSDSICLILSKFFLASSTMVGICSKFSITDSKI